MSPGELLTLIEERAHGLRVAGVLTFEIEGASVTLAPYAGEPATASQAPQPDLSDPLNDPTTFGGVLPGYRLPTKAFDEEPA
jgi:hypothetical protein